MSILLSILAGIAMTITKGLQVQRQLRSHSYRWGTFGLICLAWSAMTLPFVVSACNEAVCQWSLKFGWWAELIRQIPPFDRLDPGTTTAAVMFAFIVLTVYFLGHCIGWALYSIRSLLRLAVSRS
jgi:hypothetical protein